MSSGKKDRRRVIVLKLGSSSIVDEKTYKPKLSTISQIVETAHELEHAGHRVVIVSSGAIAMGMQQMKLKNKPKLLPQKQALAAIGQCHLMTLWNTQFGHLQQGVCQILMTRNDIADRAQYLNAQNTFAAAMDYGVIPIVNENDTIAVSEIREVDRFGDNDKLSAITAAMVQADYLFIMTDVDCLYDKNPRVHADAQPIEVVTDIHALEADVSSSGSSLGTGGMATKIIAARLATSAGVDTVISRSARPGNILSIFNYLESAKANASSNPPTRPTTPGASAVPATTIETTSSPADSAIFLPEVTSPNWPTGQDPPKHTRFVANRRPIKDRKFWLLHGLAAHGTIYIDEGAYRALSTKAGLLPVGIVNVEGTFQSDEGVRLVVVPRPNPDSEPSKSEPEVPLNSTDPSLSLRPSLNRFESTSQPVIISDCNGVPLTTSAESTSFEPFEIGRAMVNYSSTEISLIKGCQSSQVSGIIGWADSAYVALRENISLEVRYPHRPDGIQAGA